MMKRLLAALSLVATSMVPLLPGVAAPSAAAVECTVSVRLSPGAIDDAVTCLESRLLELGYGIAPPDTYYDPLTAVAVRDFQQQRGLYPDGIVTSITAREMGVRGPLPAGPGLARVTVIGDSTSAAMRWYDEANNSTSIYDIMGADYDLLWSVESCRRLVQPSCIGRTDPGTGQKWKPVSALPLMRSTLKGNIGQALVVMAGYDDTSLVTAVDDIVDEAEAQGVARVFWLNYRSTSGYAYGAYYTAHNASLEAARVRHPNLTVLDWNGYTHSQSAPTQAAWFEADGIHLTRTGAVALATFLRSAIDASDVRACVSANATVGSPDSIGGSAAPPSTVTTGYRPVTPQRMLDTRPGGIGGGSGKVGAGRTVTIDLAGALAPGAQSASLSVTAVNPCASGYLTVHACGPRPTTSNVNYVSGRTTAGLAFSLLTGTTVCVFSSAAVDLVVDLVGSFVPNGQRFHPMEPTRWVDTRGRAAVTPLSGALSPVGELDVPVAGAGPVPSDATAVWLNLTAVSQTGGGALLAYPGPCGNAPLASSVNVMAGRAAAAATVVGIGGNGGICLRAFGGSMNAVVDIAGWFGGAVQGGLEYRGETPVRLLDTRGAAAPPANVITALGSDGTTVYNVAGVGALGFGFVSAKPCGSAAVSSLLNTALRETVANLGPVIPGPDGQVCLQSSVVTNLTIDRFGQFVAPTP